MPIIPDRRATVIEAAEHLRDNRVAEDLKFVDPKNSRLFRRPLSVEVDLEPHPATLHVGIEVNEAESLARVC